MQLPGYRHRAEQGAARQRGGDRARRRCRPSGSARSVTRVHRDLGQGQGRGDRAAKLSVDRAGRHAAVDARSGRSSPAARAASAASEDRRRRLRPPGPRARSRGAASRSCRSRRCCTGCAGTAIRCTPIRNSPRRRAFRVRSCTACARYGHRRARRSSTHFLDGDVSRVHSYGARFAGVRVPGRDAAGEHLEGRRQAAGHDHSTKPRQRHRAVGVELIPA